MKYGKELAESIKAEIKSIKESQQHRNERIDNCYMDESGSGCGMCAALSGRYYKDRWHTNMVTGEYVGYPD